jgi:hypothetical protein
MSDQLRLLTRPSRVRPWLLTLLGGLLTVAVAST